MLLMRKSKEELVGMVEAIQQENKELKRSLKSAKQMFRKEWDARSQEWERMKAELAEGMKDEKALVEAVEPLKATLLQVYREANKKDEEIENLSKVVMELKNGKSEKKGTNVGRNNDGGMLAERMDAHLLFPEEVWRVIFKNVSNPKDLWNLCNTCSLFDLILEPWKTKHMFRQALPYLFQHLPGNKLLKSRSVCKGWTAAVDNFIAHHPSLRPHVNGDDPRKLNLVNPVKEKGICAQSYFSVCNAGDFHKLRGVDIPKEPGRNPFIGRHVTLDLSCYDLTADLEGEMLRNLLLEVIGFVKIFGAHIWNLTIHLPSNLGLNRDPIHFSLNERIVTDFFSWDLIPLLPNLRKLRATNTDCFYYRGNPRLTPAAFPPAPKLETVQLENDIAYGPEQLMHTILGAYRHQLRKLNLAFSGWKRVATWYWPNLTELHINWFVMNPQDLTRVARARVPLLSKLGLRLNGLGNAILDNVITAIRDLSRNSRFLNTIRLSGSLRALTKGQVIGNLQAPLGIKTLEIGHYLGTTYEGEVPSYTFLLNYFPHIENVSLYRSDRLYDYETEIGLHPFDGCRRTAMENKFQDKLEVVEVNKYVYDREMYKSNIWELLPRLNVFSFQWDVYTREGYERYSRKAIGK